MKNDFDFTEILANIKDVAEAKKRIADRLLKEEHYTTNSFPEEYYKDEYISITRVVNNIMTKVKYLVNKAEAFEYLKRVGYNEWYIHTALSEMPKKLVTFERSTFYFIQLLPNEVVVDDMYEIDVESGRFKYYISKDKEIYRKTLKTDVVTKLNPDDKGRIRIANSSSRIKVDKIWKEMRK